MKSINILFSKKKRKVTWILEECDSLPKGEIIYSQHHGEEPSLSSSDAWEGMPGMIVRGVSLKAWENLEVSPETNLIEELGLVFDNEEKLVEILMSFNFDRDHLKERSERKEEERKEAISQANEWAKEEVEEQKEGPSQSKEDKLYEITKDLFIKLNKDLDDAKSSNPFKYYLVCVATSGTLQEAIDLGKKKGLTDSMIEQLMEECGLLNHFTKRK